jgi:hypothetical protein
MASWKDMLLRSGVPLENVVTDMLSAYEIWPYEYEYERPDRSGIVTNFSIDVLVPHSAAAPPVAFDFLCECKYARPGTDWVFFRDEQLTPGGPDPQSPSASVTVQANEAKAGGHPNTNDIRAYLTALPHGRYGVEMTDDKNDKVRVKDSLYQLAYAVAHRSMEMFVAYRDLPQTSGAVPYFYAVAPFVVTTAELRLMQPAVTIDAIRDAKDIDAVSEKVDVVIVQRQAEPALLRYERSLYHERLDELYPGWREADWDRPKAPWPQRDFIVCHVSKLQEIAGELRQLFWSLETY